MVGVDECSVYRRGQLPFDMKAGASNIYSNTYSVTASNTNEEAMICFHTGSYGNAKDCHRFVLKNFERFNPHFYKLFIKIQLQKIDFRKVFYVNN